LPDFQHVLSRQYYSFSDDTKISYRKLLDGTTAGSNI
jgi:hypothetical protein